MTKKGLIESLTKFCGGSLFVRRKQLSAYLGYADAHQVDRYLVDLERVGTGYYIPDVCERLLES